MTQQQHQHPKEKEQHPQWWEIVKKSSDHLTSDQTKEDIRQIYSDTAHKYHQYRPKYPTFIINQAIEQSPLLKETSSRTPKVLEIGCGPGTLTIELGRRGYDVTAIDPGIGMIEKAKEVCKDLPNVKLRTTPFQSFECETRFDAIFAATSMHWALAEGDKHQLIHKLESSLEDDGTLILLWNYPNMPTSTSLRNKIADALNEPKPYSFGFTSQEVLHKRMIELVHNPIQDSYLFQPFQTQEINKQENLLIEDFIGLLQTTSHYITMDDAKRKHVLEVIEDVMKQEYDCDGLVPTSRKLILDVTRKRRGVN